MGRVFPCLSRSHCSASIRSPKSESTQSRRAFARRTATSNRAKAASRCKSTRRIRPTRWPTSTSSCPDLRRTRSAAQWSCWTGWAASTCSTPRPPRWSCEQHSRPLHDQRRGWETVRRRCRRGGLALRPSATGLGAAVEPGEPRRRTVHPQPRCDALGAGVQDRVRKPEDAGRSRSGDGDPRRLHLSAGQDPRRPPDLRKSQLARPAKHQTGPPSDRATCHSAAPGHGIVRIPSPLRAEDGGFSAVLLCPLVLIARTAKPGHG